MKYLYEIGILASSVVTTAVVTHVVTKKEDEKKFIQFKQNMEELKKENLKLREKCSDDEDEIESLEKELKETKNDFHEAVTENYNIINFFDEYQNASFKIFDTVAKPLTGIVNEEYLDVADTVIHAKTLKELNKAFRKLERTEYKVNFTNESGMDFMQSSILDPYDEDDDDDEEEDDDDINLIDRMCLGDIMTPDVYKSFLSKLENLSEDNAILYKSIFDNILEYIFIKRKINPSSNHANEINDLKLVYDLNIDNEIAESMDEFYENMKFSINNINDVYSLLLRYKVNGTNKFLNKVKSVDKEIVIKFVPDILCNIDNVTDNNDRIDTIMTLSAILRKMNELINTDEVNDNCIKEFSKLSFDINLLRNKALSKEKLAEYLEYEEDAISEYIEEFIQEYSGVLNENE